MKTIIFIALALVAAVDFAAAKEPSKILKAELTRNPSGSYHSAYETENGITSEQHGELKQTVDEDNKPRDVIIIRGSYTYINNQGQPETISYFADENGFHPQGDSIPQRPEARR